MTRDERDLGDLLRDLTAPPAGLAARVFADFRAEPQRSSEPPPWLLGVASIAIAAAMVGTLLLVSGHAGLGRSGPTTAPARGNTGQLPRRTCGALELKLVGVGSVAGAVRAEFELLNNGGSACQMSGWPRVEALDGQGRLLSASALQVSAGFAESATELEVRPGGRAFFGLTWAPTQAAGGTCAEPASLRVAAPNGSHALTLAVLGKLPAVCGGAVSVLPVQPAPPPDPSFLPADLTAASCPSQALEDPGPTAAADVRQVATQLIPTIYASKRLASWAIANVYQARPDRDYGQVAYGLCGVEVGARTLVVEIVFPSEAPSQSAAQGQLFFGRYRSGWAVWFQYH